MSDPWDDDDRRFHRLFAQLRDRWPSTTGRVRGRTLAELARVEDDPRLRAPDPTHLGRRLAVDTINLLVRLTGLDGAPTERPGGEHDGRDD